MPGAARSPFALGRLRRDVAVAGDGEGLSGFRGSSAAGSSGARSRRGTATLNVTLIAFDSQAAEVCGSTPSAKSATRCAVSEARRTAIHRPARSRAAWDTKHLSTEVRQNPGYPRGQTSIRIRRPYHRPEPGQTGEDLTEDSPGVAVIALPTASSSAAASRALEWRVMRPFLRGADRYTSR